MPTHAVPTVAEVCAALETIAPLRLAQEWDNVGLLVGDRAAACPRVLLSIDTTPAVLAEAGRLRCALLIAYHPVLFRPIKTVRTGGRGTDALVHEAIRRGIAIYSPHTALDAAEGGTNDVLAGLCGLADIQPFEYAAAASTECKIVAFVPPDAVDAVAEAMFAAGAGRIGLYEKCSYRLRGRGTFFGTEATNPAVGAKGRLETVDEIRLEMVVPRDRVPEVVDAMTAAHPYETPAYDVYPLQGPVAPGVGRVGTLPRGTSLGAFAKALTRTLGAAGAQIVGHPKARIRRVAVCVGAAGLLPLERARSSNAEVIVTGEIRHHDALTLLRAGKAAVALGHWESERPVLPALASRLRSAVRGVRVDVSRADAAPFQRV